MSSSGTAGSPSILIVSDSDDASVRHCAAALTEVGGRVQIVPDVYTAMATLALDTGIHRVLVDVRTLDAQEIAFLNLAQRCYPTSQVLVPSFGGTAERIARSGEDLQAVDVALIADAIRAESAPRPAPEAHPATKEPDPTQHHEEVAAGQAEAAPLGALPDARAATPQPPLSTAGGPDSAPSGPSLHDAVRERMAGDDPRQIRRVPPRVAPPTGSVADPRDPAAPAQASGIQPPELSAPAPALTPEEMDALLAGEEADPPPIRPGGGDGDAEGAS